MITASWVQPLADVLAEHPVLGRLCFASVEFAALALAAAGLLALLRRRSPRLAALLWLVVMAKPLVGLVVGAPLPLFGLTLPAPPPQPVFVTPQPELPEPPQPAATMIVMHAPVAPAPPAAPPIDWAAQAPRLILGAWLAGVGAFALRLLLSAVRLARLTRRAAAPPAWVAERLAALGQEMDRMEHGSPGGHDEGNTERGRQGCRRNFNLPRCLITTQLESPALAGFWRPVILLPAWVCAEGDPVRIEWSLRHELMHWRLRDPLASLVCELVKILFFFHPAAWWAGRRWQEATELACDRALIRSVEEAEAYVQELYRMLLKVRDRRRLPLAGGLFAGRTQISRRIASLVQDPLRSPARLSAAAMAFVVAFSLATLALGVGIKKEKPVEQASAPTAAVPDEKLPAADGDQSSTHTLMSYIEKSLADSIDLNPRGLSTLRGNVQIKLMVSGRRIVVLADRAEYSALDNQNRILRLHRDVPDATIEKLAALAKAEPRKGTDTTDFWVTCDRFRIEHQKDTQIERVILEGDVAFVSYGLKAYVNKTWLKHAIWFNTPRVWFSFNNDHSYNRSWTPPIDSLSLDETDYVAQFRKLRAEARRPLRPLPAPAGDVSAEKARVAPADRQAALDLLALKAQAQRDRKTPEEVVGLIREALRKDPTCAPAWVALAEWLPSLKNKTHDADAQIKIRVSDPEVWDAYAKALSYDPANMKALCGVADICRKTNHPAEAAQYLDRALKAHPQDVTSLGEWVGLDLDASDFASAHKHLQQMKAIDPKNIYTRQRAWDVMRAEAESRGEEPPPLTFDDLEAYPSKDAENKPEHLVFDPGCRVTATSRNLSRDPATGAFILRGEARITRTDSRGNSNTERAETIRIERDADGKSIKVVLNPPVGAPAQTATVTSVTLGADLPFDRMSALSIDIGTTTGIIELRGKVRIESKDFNLSCEELKLDNKTKILTATGGRVKCTQGTSVQGECRNLTYNLKTRSSELDGEASIFNTNPNGQQVQAMCDVIKIDYPPAQPGEKPEDVQPRVSFISKGGVPPTIKVLNKETVPGKPAVKARVLSPSNSLAMPLAPKTPYVLYEATTTTLRRVNSPTSESLREPVGEKVRSTVSGPMNLGPKVTLSAKGMTLDNLFTLIRMKTGARVAAKGKTGKLKVDLDARDKPLEEVLDEIARKHKLTWIQREDGSYETHDQDSIRIPPALPTRIRFFPLHFINANSLLKEVEPLLTPEKGTAAVDDRKNCLIVTDLPAKIAQVEKLVQERDKPRSPAASEPANWETLSPGAVMSPHGLITDPMITALGAGGEPLGGLGKTYLAIVVNRVEEEFMPSAATPDAHCTVGFTVAKNGSLSQARVEQSSGDARFDAQALQALEATKLPPLYDGMKTESAAVRLTFNAHPLPSGPPRPEEVKFEDITITPPDPAHPEAGYRLSDRMGQYQGRAGKITADPKARTITLTGGVELIHELGGVKIQDKADKLEMVFDAKRGMIQIKGKTETKILNPVLPLAVISPNPGGNGLISDLSFLMEPPTGQGQLDHIQVNRISVYLYEAVKALEDRFEPPLEAPRARCMVGFTILKDGKISEPRIIMASTNPKFNAEVHHVLEVVKLPPMTEKLPAFMEMRPPLKGGLGLETLPVVLTFNARPAPIAHFSEPVEPGAPKTPEKKESPEELLSRAAEFYEISVCYYQEWLRNDRQRAQIETRSEGAFALQYLNLAVRGYSEALKANPKLDGAARKKIDEHLLSARTMRLKLEDANQAGKTP